MDELLGLLQEAATTYEKVIMNIAMAELKLQQDRRMDIENESVIENHNCQPTIYLHQNSENQFNFFDSLPDNVYTEALDSKISNIKMNSVSIRRKDQLFKRQKRQQEEKIIQRRKQLQLRYPFNASELKFQGQFWIKIKEKNQIFAFKQEDFQKLRPEADLNDTIMDNYLKLMQLTILPEEVANKTFIFSTFFMGKLLGDQLRDDIFPERQSESTIEKVKKKVVEAYPTMKRWTKKIDLFSKEYIVIPINAYKHWNCMIVVSPGSLLTEGGQCKIIYLDSMMEKKQIFPEAIKVFLQLELADRKNIATSLENSVQSYQLLVPRQTNTHDCGLYTLCYIEYLLKNHEIIDENMEIIRNRQHLRLFPRSLVFTMRQTLRQFFKNLLQNENKEEAIRQYIAMRTQTEKNSNEADFDEINQRQFKKYYRLNSHLLEEKKKKEAEVQYQCKIVRQIITKRIRQIERDEE